MSQVSDDLTSVISGIKLPIDIKQVIQQDGITYMLRQNKIKINIKIVDILSKVAPGMMMQAKGEDVDISKTMHYGLFLHSMYEENGS